MVVVIDPQIAGISGDMMLCALVDLGADPKRITDGVRESARLFDGCGVDAMGFERTRRGSVSALELRLETGDAGGAASGSGGGARDSRTGHAHTASGVTTRKGTDMMDAMRRSSAVLGLSDAASAYASECVDILIRSESRVHGVPAGSVEFHEAADIDTIVDVMGTAIALDDLGLLGEDIRCLPVCVGGGTVGFSHGIMSNPAGAVLEVLQKHALWMCGSAAGRELATPTGACMLAALHPEPIAFYPCMRVDSVGYGAGAAESGGFANVLKIVRGPERGLRGGPYASGSATDAADIAASDAMIDGCMIERICMLETNVDDASGELLGGMVEKLMGAGAKDVTICPAVTKKNRPSHVISVMCSGPLSGRIAGILMAETGTLGVRISNTERLVAPRVNHKTTIDVGGRAFDVRYKSHWAARGKGYARYDDHDHTVRRDDGCNRADSDTKAGDAVRSGGTRRTARIDSGLGRVRFKVEYDDVKAISAALDLPARDVESILYQKIQKIIQDDPGCLRHGSDDVCDDSVRAGALHLPDGPTDGSNDCAGTARKRGAVGASCDDDLDDDNCKCSDGVTDCGSKNNKTGSGGNDSDADTSRESHQRAGGDDL